MRLGEVLSIQHRDWRTGTGDTATVAFANRLVGILHGCLCHGELYDEDTAWAHRLQAAAA